VYKPAQATLPDPSGDGQAGSAHHHDLEGSSPIGPDRGREDPGAQHDQQTTLKKSLTKGQLLRHKNSLLAGTADELSPIIIGRTDRRL